MSGRYRVHTDGASRGNPGRASIGVSIEGPDGEEVATASEAIGTTTNNVAEYTALIRALELLVDLGAAEADFNLDSELIVRQLSGQYKVKDAKMKVLHTQVRRGLTGLKHYTVSHVRREQNRRADELANLALGPK